MYYNTINAKKAAASRRQDTERGPDENSPLLANREAADDADTKDAAVVEDILGGNAWVRNIAALLAVHAIGFAGWFVSVKAGALGGSSPDPSTTASEERTIAEAVGLFLGYVSAVFYLW